MNKQTYFGVPGESIWGLFLVTKSDLIHDSCMPRFYDEGDQSGHRFTIQPDLMFDFWNIAIWGMRK